MSVITRFAPSPTGFLHIGGARTALFNYLFARANDGRYLLRIEDTDKARSTGEAKQAILDGLAWLGLDHDGEVVYQSEHMNRHVEVAQQLLAEGKAYQCYCTPEELAEMREQAKAEGRGVAYDKRWRDRDPADAPAGIDPVIRIKAPLNGSITIDDVVQGRVEVSANQLDDFILLRADGTPTYMLAVVVDDHDMGITHIIRGDDHLNNAFRQCCLFDTMGWDRPVFAHIPLIHGADGAKLSKRHGALGVEEYQKMGYLPEALRNYLLRLGWSHGDDEIISDAQAIEWFNLEHINKAAARFDFDKLNNLNGHYIREAENEQLVPLVIPLIEHSLNNPLSDEQKTRLEKALPALKERAKTLNELAASSLFYFRSDNPPENDKAHKQLEGGKPLIKQFLPELEAQNEWNHEALFAFAKSWAESQDMKIGKLMAPIRVAITGSTAAPSMFEVMETLGKDETLARLKAAC